MPAPELGLKRTCIACNTKFYDLGHTPAVCPKCGTEQPADQPRPRRSGGNLAEERRAKKPVPAPGIEEAEAEVETTEEEEAEEDVLEDTSELEDDDVGGEIDVDKDADEAER